ncbi:MAG: biotin/lipoyl-binding protein, partial [Alphaproteobacteria bacterium]|nr:biotin/lipoyl-binding protein [Alphaproteobacteria bacterium]
MGAIRRDRVISGLAGLVILALLAWWLSGSPGDDSEFDFTFGEVDKGDIVQVISATGRVNPMNSVEVGSQLSGQVSEILVDFNDQVSAGEVIARIDPQTFEAQVQQARAELQVAKSNEAVSKADVTKAKAALKKAKREFERKEKLVEKGHTSASDLDIAREAYDVAKAEVLSAEAR